MNKLFTKIAALALGATMAVGVGVAVASSTKEATPVHAAESITNTITFGGGAKNSSYTGTFTETDSASKGWTIQYFNNNNWGWSSSVSGANKTVKCGRKNTASVGSVYNTATFGTTTKFTKVDLYISALTSGKLNSIKVYGGASSGTSGTELASTTSITASTSTPTTLTLSNQSTYAYYTIAFDMASGSSNGLLSLDKVCWYQNTSTPLTGITLGGAASQNALSIGSSDLTAKTVSVTLNPSGATDQKVNIAHQSGTSGLFTVSSSATCSSGSGSFTVTGKGNTSGSETFRISGNTETSVYVDLVVTALDDSATYWTVSFDVAGGSASIADMEVEDGDTFEFPSPGTKDHHSFDGWSSDGGNTLYDAGDESPIVGDDIEYTAYWTQDAQTTVIYKSGDGTGSDISSTEYAGSYSLASFPGTWTAPSGKAFSKWSDGSSQYSAGANYTLVGNTTVTFTAVYKAVDEYTLFSGDLVEGDYVIYSDGAALKNSIASNRAEYTSVSPSNNKIIDPDNSIVWSIQKSGESSWLVVSKDDGKYLAGNGTKNQIGLFDDTSADRTWSITGPTDGAYSLVSNRNNSASVNDTLRRNGTYGFACYGLGTGTGISLYKAPSNELDHVTTSGQTTSFTAGNTFSYGGTLTAYYTIDDPVTKTPTSFKLDSESGATITTSTVLTKADHDGHEIYVLYTEDKITKSAHYTITVDYAAVTSVEIGTHTAEIGLNDTYDDYLDPDKVSVTIDSQYANQGYEWIVSATTVGDDYAFDESGLLSGDTEGTITLRCRSTADNSKYDELVVTVTGNPTAEFTPTSVSGYVGKSDDIAFTYGNMSDTSLISITSSNSSIFEVDEFVADAGEGLVTVNFVAAGSATLSVSYDGGSTLDSITVTVSTDSVTALTWSAPTIKVYSGATTTVSDASSWNVHYTMASGDEGDLSYGEYTIKLGGSSITLPHTWDASEDGKVLSIEYGGFASPTTSTVNVTQTLRAVMAPVEGEPTTSTLTFTEKYATGGATSSGGEEWVVESDGTESNFDDTKGIHYGTGSAAVQYIKLTTDDFASGTITKVVVNASTASGVSATAGVTIGGDQFGGDPQSLSSSATNYTFTGSAAAGEIVVTITKPSSATKAIYCLSVAVTYAESSGTQNIANVAGHEAAQKAVVAFAKAMNAAFDNTANCTDGVAAAWTTASNAYSSNIADNASLSADEKAYAKNLIKYASAQYTDDTDNDYSYCLERAMATYEACIQKHGQTAFMSDVRLVSASSRITPLSIVNGNGNTVAIIVIVSMISVAAIGGYFLFRRRKEQ